MPSYGSMSANQLDDQREWETFRLTKWINKTLYGEKGRIHRAEPINGGNFWSHFALEYSRNGKCFETVQRWTTVRQNDHII